MVIIIVRSPCITTQQNEAIQVYENETTGQRNSLLSILPNSLQQSFPAAFLPFLVESEGNACVDMHPTFYSIHIDGNTIVLHPFDQCLDVAVQILHAAVLNPDHERLLLLHTSEIGEGSTSRWAEIWVCLHGGRIKMPGHGRICAFVQIRAQEVR